MENKANKTAIIAGASGLIGKQLLYCLIESGHYQQIIALVRKEMPIASPNLVQVIANFDDLAALDISLKADDVFCCLGTTIKKAGSKEAFEKVDYTYCLQLAQETFKQNAQSFYLVSAMGANEDSSIFYNQVKGKLEQSIKAIGFHSFYIFRPSLLLGNRNEFRLGERLAQIITKPLSLLMVGVLKKYKPIAATHVAKAMLKSAQSAMKGFFILENDEIEKIATQF